MSSMTSQNTDIIELYSFGIFLNIHVNFYNFILNHQQSFFKSIIYIFFGNLLFSFLFKFNVIDILFHKYWKHQLRSIALPQLINSFGTVVIKDITLSNHNFNNFSLKMMLLGGLHIFLLKYCHQETRRSKILRYNYYLFYYLFAPLFLPFFLF